MNLLIVEENIRKAINEDLKYGDITTASIILDNKKASVDIISKENGILSGIQIFKMVFKILGDVKVEFLLSDGDTINDGMVIGHVYGDAKKILIGERVALNYIQRMSGISTITNEFVKRVSGTKAKIVDTRKTTPNMRIFEKYAVTIGGGVNHRFSLNDGILIKDNHISAANGVRNAIYLAKNNASFVRKIEIEVERIDQLKEVLKEKVDIIMLDNMNIKTLKEAIKLIDNNSKIEVSGNINLKNVSYIAKLGVDFISVGSITHSFKSLDISMKNFRYMD